MKYYSDQTFTDNNITEDTLTDKEFEFCTFINCTVQQSSIQYCTFTECTFINCKILNNKYNHTVLSSNIFDQCTLYAINWSELSGDGAIMLPFDKLTKSLLKYNSFFEIALNKFNFEGTDITDSDFDRCNLQQSNFYKCNLTNTRFSNCNMQKANFTNAHGYQIDIKTNNLKDACFSAAEAVSLLYSIGIKIK